MQGGTTADKDLRADGQLGKLVAHYVRTSNANYHEIDQRLKGGRNSGNRGGHSNHGDHLAQDFRTFIAGWLSNRSNRPSNRLE